MAVMYAIHCGKFTAESRGKLYFILPFGPSSHKSDIGHVRLSLHSLHYIKTFIRSIHNKGTYKISLFGWELTRLTSAIIYGYLQYVRAAVGSRPHCFIGVINENFYEGRWRTSCARKQTQ